MVDRPDRKIGDSARNVEPTSFGTNWLGERVQPVIGGQAIVEKVSSRNAAGEHLSGNIGGCRIDVSSQTGYSLWCDWRQRETGLRCERSAGVRMINGLHTPVIGSTQIRVGD